MTIVLELGEEDVPAVTRVLSDAFHDYPVMRHVLGGHHEDYDRRLSTLIRFFAMARVLRDEKMLGVEEGADFAAAALVSYPGRRESPEELAVLRDKVWEELGAQTKSRYDAFATACAPFDVPRPHIHLNMIGVSRAARGSGLGRALMDHVHRMSRDDPASKGVTLTTEDPSNVPLYEHFGYEVVGHARVAEGLETWGFFRPDQP